MKTVYNYSYTVQERIFEDFEVDDPGNFALEVVQDNGGHRWINVHTNQDSWTTITTMNLTKGDKFQILFRGMICDLKKIQKEVQKFLGGEISTVIPITEEEFLKMYILKSKMHLSQRINLEESSEEE